MSYSILKLLHVAGVIIFLGNIIAGHFWMHLAMKSKDFNILKYSIKGVMHSDRVFTIPAVIVIIAAGVLAAFYGNIPVLRTGWILWSIALFTLSGVIFSTRLSVLLRRMIELAGHGGEWNSIEQLYRQWNTWAIVAILMPFTALIMMVLKIPR